jgi:hypothetical protein
MKDSAEPAKPVRVKSDALRQRRSRQRRWSNVIGCIWIFAAIVTVADLAGAMLYRSSPDSTGVDAGAMHIGNIREERGGQECTLAKFDNDTGRTIEDSHHCENTAVLNAHGVPVPVGTVHRLESISKSFTSQSH